MVDRTPRKSGHVVPLVLLSAAIITGVVVYVIVTSESGSLEYFKNVDEVLGAPAKWTNRRLRLHGNVVKGTIQKKPDSLDYRFAVFSKGKWLEVSYSGLVPDTFKDCAEVVVKGTIPRASTTPRTSTSPRTSRAVGERSRLRFVATEITAKCPSKYDEQQRLRGCGEQLKPEVLASRSPTRR